MFPKIRQETRVHCLDAVDMIARKIKIPIATGERFFTVQQFAALVQRGAVQYIRPDVCLAGGLTNGKKSPRDTSSLGHGLRTPSPWLSPRR